MGKFGDWNIIKTIGEGGQGQIHLVKNEKGEPSGVFALKKLTNKNRIQRFEKEILAGMKLKHPNIIEVIEYDLENKRPYLVMKYFEEGDMTNLNIVSFSLNEKIEIFRKICEAVAFAHKNKVIHRDIKPENIFMENQFEPIVGDFGLCFFHDEERITNSDEVIGSRYYMAPELADGKFEDITYAADVYSLGKLFYWMLTGKIFDREKHNDEKYKITKNEKTICFLINEVLNKAIIENPENRLQNACELVKEIDNLEKRISMGANPIGPKIPLNCIFCGIGEYHRISGNNGMFVGIESSGFNFSDNWHWTILQCDYCNNIQIFSPMIEGSTNKWTKK